MSDTLTDRIVVPLTSAAAQATTECASAANDQTRSAADQDQRAGDGAASIPDRGERPSVECQRQPGPPPPDIQPPFRLKDIQIGRPDGRKVPITHIYAVQDDEYAIYQAGEVMVHYADDPAKAQAQRKSLLPLSAARAEVNALLQGLGCREICDRQLAYALQLALDGDVDSAKTAIAAAKAAVVAKRASRGRFQYLKWSCGAAVLLMGLLFLASRFYPFEEPSSNLWLAAKAGLVGAAFSIALAIRGRTVALDTDLLDNVTDGTLRLVIGVVSAGILLLLFKSGVVPSLKIGDAELQGAALTWQLVLVIGFLGGFLERLVPDLLEKRNAPGNAGNGTSAVGPAVR
ncbi:MAG TPA: hypothetical protein VKI44_13170 [Acetobacteraceae bacterium]|nr:hypothetical protein [Acetobacteraceae bacterium]